ncbi:MAG: hypothetical protein JXQ29_13130 [Planctomycetes bacterium]|nr:hypothetical protein [Planctomycetota bacterium]
MFGHKVKLPPELWERARRHAAEAGFATVDEFVVRAVEKELERARQDPSDEETRKRLEGLGYIS